MLSRTGNMANFTDVFVKYIVSKCFQDHLNSLNRGVIPLWREATPLYCETAQSCYCSQTPNEKKIVHKFKNMQVKFFTFLLQFSFRFVTRSYKLYLEKSLFSPYFPSVKVYPWAKLARNYKIFPFEFLNKRKRHER